jgi:hypothetical protein
MIPGKEITLGENKYVMPPIPFIALKKHKALLARLTSGDLDPQEMIEKHFDGIFDCVYLTLKRNYKDLTEAVLAEDLDVVNVKDAIMAMLSVAGFPEKPAVGEPQPAKS